MGWEISVKPLSWNEIRKNATAFVHEWKGTKNERAEAQSFLNEFFQVFGISRRRVASFERAVKRASGNAGFIDAFWPGVMIVEMKSEGRDLDAAYDQAFDYFPGLKEEELPKYVMVCDFKRFRLMELEKGWEVEFELEDLLDNLQVFGFIAGYETRTYDEQDPVNLEAVEKMARLHDRLREAGYRGHDLQVYLVRLLFCMFAEDTGIFNRDAFRELIENRSMADGSDLAGLLNLIFETLNTPLKERMTGLLDEEIEALPYVNGRLFGEPLRQAAFDAEMRQMLLEACRLDWGAISPAIFGSLFQGVMDTEERRSLGAHYTSEKNIMKLIGPLFLDELWAEFEKSKGSTAQLNRLHQQIAELRLLDPACGCGNFLVIAYRELRRLELAILKALQERQHGQRVYNIESLVRLDVDMMYGIEIEEFPAQIAQVALWLVDHQMNLEAAAAFGEYFRRLPLKKTPNILYGNALQVDWTSCFGEEQPEKYDFILGNPPFIGKQYRSSEQTRDHEAVLGRGRKAGVLDYVCGWFVKGADYMVGSPDTRTAFVATNSVSQGQQVSNLWSRIFEKGALGIDFAHRTFAWTNDARGRAAVHVVIIGFSLANRPPRLFDYDDLNGEPFEVPVRNINPYLVGAPTVLVASTRKPICNVPKIAFGSMPNDGGNLLLTPEEREALLEAEPEVEPYIRRMVGSEEFINGIERYCLWLSGVEPQTLRVLRLTMERVRKVADHRRKSSREATRKLANTPTLFGEIRQPTREYLAIPKTSSSNRLYIPMGFLPRDVIASSEVFTIAEAKLYDFGILTSQMHMTWVRYVAGRLKSDYRYSAGLAYNTFPWPEVPSSERVAEVESAAQAILEARKPYLAEGATYADLYDPLATPPELIRAHQKLDRLVDLLYRPQAFPREANRMAYLFDRYERLLNQGVAEKA